MAERLWLQIGPVAARSSPYACRSPRNRRKTRRLDLRKGFGTGDGHGWTRIDKSKKSVPHVAMYAHRMRCGLLSVCIRVQLWLNSSCCRFSFMDTKHPQPNHFALLIDDDPQIRRSLPVTLEGSLYRV